MWHGHSAQLGSSDVLCVFCQANWTQHNSVIYARFCHSLAHFSHGGVLVVTPYSFSISHAGNGAFLASIPASA